MQNAIRKMNAYPLIIPCPSYPSKHPHIRFTILYYQAFSIRNNGISEKIIEPRENNEFSEKATKLPTIFYSPVIIGAVIFKFTTKSITKERMCIMKILKAKRNKKRANNVSR